MDTACGCRRGDANEWAGLKAVQNETRLIRRCVKEDLSALKAVARECGLRVIDVMVDYNHALIA